MSAQPTPKPSVVEKATIEYFNVRGSTVAAVSAELNRLSPRHDGRPVYGKYQYAFKYDYATRVTAGGCEPVVTVGLTSKTILPKWIDVSAGDSATQRQWSYFLNNLTVHENGHRTIALSIANAMQQSMSAIRAPSCAGHWSASDIQYFIYQRQYRFSHRCMLAPYLDRRRHIFEKTIRQFQICEDRDERGVLLLSHSVPAFLVYFLSHSKNIRQRHTETSSAGFHRGSHNSESE